MDFNHGVGYERACRLSNTTHSEIAPFLPLPSLPVCFGDDGLPETPAVDFRAADRSEILSCAGAVADLLRNCDISYLDLKGNSKSDGGRNDAGECSRLYQEVLKHDRDAFKWSSRGPPQAHVRPSEGQEKKPLGQNKSENLEYGGDDNDHSNKNSVQDHAVASSRKQKNKKKESIPVQTLAGPELTDNQGIISNFCEMVEDFCGRAEFLDDGERADGTCLSLVDIRRLVNEIMSLRSKKVLQLIQLDPLTRLVNVLDCQIQCAQGLSLDSDDDPGVDVATLIFSALEATHAALAIMAHQDMPKQLYKEEIIERILDFSRHQIMESMAAYNPSFSSHQKPTDNGADYDDEDDDEDVETVAKRRRTNKSVGVKKSSGSKVSAAVSSVIQKLCSILGFLKDLLSAVRLSDSCILQLVKTSFSTFLVDGLQLLQMKSIDLICGVYASYAQHRSFLIDETVQLVRKIQFSKRAVRSFLLQDEEQKQIQMITALLIQLVQFSSNLPETIRTASSWNTILETSLDADYLSKSHDAATETCCSFWTSILQRLTTAKAHDATESKVILENLVMDLLTILNLPEYPAAASILEVLCVLLLQNTGLKSKDISARCMAVDLLGTIAARLKHDAVTCSKDRLWILNEIYDEDNAVANGTNDSCSVCLNCRGSTIVCHLCKRCFHADCVGISGQDLLLSDWSCYACVSKKQLLVLLSYCKSQSKDDVKKKARSGDSNPVSGVEVVQQIVLNYLQESGSEDDVYLFTRWFYLCLWYKDEPQSQERPAYYLARLKAKTILRDSGNNSSFSRDWVKRTCLALAQKNSFSRGFDKILSLLLASLRENSPVLRSKALRAVSVIVEADPEVLCDKRVQSAVEGRFCDSAISVREAALELVGRHIASHPDVGLKYFEKVTERIKDTGVSVRKRAIKIIRDLCTSRADVLESTHAFIEIISRVTDEEASVQDLVCKTFYELWFEEPTGNQKYLIADGSSVPIEIAKKAEQIVDILRKMPSNHFIVTIIKRNLALDFLPQSAKASGISSAALASVRKRCELICKHLLERILQVEEGSSNENDNPALPYVLALHSFCVVDPTLCAPATDQSKFVVTLQPYLKNQVDNKSIAQLLESIIFIIDAVLPLLRKPPQNIIEELEQDLKQMIVRHSYLTVVHACIKCLCSLSKIAGKGASVVEYLINIFLKHLHTPSSDNKQLLGRSLFCLGLLIRYGNKLIVSGTAEHLHMSKSLVLLMKYLEMEDLSLKVRALQALGYILIARPEYMLQKNIGELLESSLSTSADLKLKVQILQNFYEYLLDAEAQLGTDGDKKNESTYPEHSQSAVPVAAGAGDTNICGGIVQLYWNCILQTCLDVSDHIRQSTLKILEVVLRQGLVHPITCVPYLVALETDPVEANWKLAHHLLMNMNEKYPAFFESRLGDGLQMSFKFVQAIACNHNVLYGNVRGKSDGNPLTFARPGVSRIYKLIKANRASRNKFIHSIIRKFESGSWNTSSVSFLVYCSEILASLPFTSPDEPLYLIYDINRVIQVRAGTLEANMKAWSFFLQQRGFAKISSENNNMNFECNSMNFESSGLYSVHPLPEGTAAVSGNSCEISKEDFRRFQADCHEAIALQLLMKLKRYFKIVYGLNDERCQAFSLKEPPKPGETISRQNIPFNVSDTQTTLPSSYEGMVEKYQEFKVSLREDTMDYTIYVSDVKRKRPTPRSQKSGKGAPARADQDEDDENCMRGARRSGSARSTTRNQRGGKATRHKGDDDDDDYDDDDWTGGARMLDFGGQNSNSVRITRQRMQVYQT